MLVGFLLYYLSTIRIKNQLAIEKIKTKIASDLHDNVGAGLTEISILSELAVQKSNKPDISTTELRKISDTSRQLVDIMSEHITKDKALAAINLQTIYASVGITAANEHILLAKLVDQEFVNAVFAASARAFITAMKPHFGTTPLRVKLRRSSKTSHFPRIPFKGDFPEVWIESMQIPAASSKIAWSKWEIENGINDGTPTQADTEPKADATAAAAAFNVGAPVVTPAAVPGTEPRPEAVVTPNVVAPVEAEAVVPNLSKTDKTDPFS